MKSRVNSNEEPLQRYVNDELHRELVTRVLELTHKWLQDYRTMDDLVQAVTMEQLLTSTADDTWIWVKECKPKIISPAANLWMTTLKPKKQLVSPSAVKFLACDQTGHGAAESSRT